MTAVSQPVPESRWVVGCFAAGLLAAAGLLLAVPVLPFQDVPNHLHLLRVDRALREGHLTEYLHPRQVWVFGYSLYILLARGLGALPVEQVLRGVLILAGVGLPLAIARLAREFGQSAAWAGLLSLPLALSWPLRMGLVPYALALPLLVLSLVPLLRVCRGSWRAVPAYAALSALCYLAHPLIFAFAGLLGGVAWLLVAKDRGPALLRTGLGLLPSVLLMGWDLSVRAFSQIPGTERSWEPSPVYFRPLTRAVAHLVTRSWGISGPWMLVLCAPFLLAMVLLLLRAVRPEGGPGSRERRFLVAAVLLGLAASLCTPGSAGTTWVLGERLAVLAPCFLPLLVLPALPSTGRARLAVVASVLVALAGAGAEVGVRASQVHAIVHGAERAGLQGRYLTFRLSDCQEVERSRHWGLYDPLRHVWAYSLSVDGVTPYLFAFSRYLPVLYEGEQYARALRAPREWDANEERPVARPDACHAWDVRQVRLAQAYGSYDGLIVVGKVERLERVLGSLEASAVERMLASGMALLHHERPPARAAR